MAATTGVFVAHTSGYGTDTPNLTARGTTVNSFQIDGVQSSSSLQNYLQSTAIYDRIEVVRGATGLMNSLGTPAATVNMVRKRPTYEPQIKLSAEAGNWDRYGSGIDVSGPLTESGNVRAVWLPTISVKEIGPIIMNRIITPCTVSVRSTSAIAPC